MRASFIVGYNFNVKNESVREVRDGGFNRSSQHFGE